MRASILQSILAGSLLCAASAAFGQLPGTADESLTPQQRREVQRLAADYRRARRDPRQMAEVVERAVALGRPAVDALLPNIERELHPQLTSYRGKFFQQASLLANQQLQQVNLEEVAQLRQTVVGLQHQPRFSNELIVQQGDPALKRLEEIFVVDREKVLAAAPALQETRQQLAELGQLWQRCAVFRYEQLPEGEQKPKEPPSFEAYLQGEEELAAGMAAPMDPQTRRTLSINARLSSRLDPEEARAVLALNLTRNLLGLPAVLVDLRLTAAARDHSQDMRTHNFFAHESPVPGKATPWDRAAHFSTTASAENIAMGFQDGKAVNLAWFHSPGHHKNMLGDHKRVGIGRSGVHFTELFGR